MPRVERSRVEGSGPSPGTPRPPGKGRDYLLKGLGLVAIAVVSGVIWYLLNAGGGGAQSPQAQGEYQFRKVTGPVSDSDCAANAYGDVADFLGTHPCQRLVRELYTSSPAAGSKVVTSVASVRMPNAQSAGALKRMTDTDDTGNVDDLVRAGVHLPGAPDDLGNGGYASIRRGKLVIIVESDYLGHAANPDRKLLVKVSQDALRLGKG